MLISKKAGKGIKDCSKDWFEAPAEKKLVYGVGTGVGLSLGLIGTALLISKLGFTALGIKALYSTLWQSGIGNATTGFNFSLLQQWGAQGGA